MKVHNEKLLENFYKHEKTNVAILTDIYLPFSGGVSMVTDKLANSLHNSNKVNVVLISGKVKNYKDKATYPVIRCKSMPIPKAFGNCLAFPKLDFKLKKLLKKLKIDVIHIHSIFSICKFGLKFASKNNIPAIMHIHSKFSEEFPTIIKCKPICNIFVRKKYKLIDKGNLILAVSNSTKENLLLHNTKTPIEVLPNATDMTKFLNTQKAFEFIFEKYNIKPNEENIFLNVSRLEIECKNLKFLLESLKIVKECGVSYKLLMVGGGPDENKLKTLIKELNLEENVILTGSITNREILKYYYLRADLFLFPSIVDNCPLVKLEAASQKTPTIALENTGASEGIINGFNGYTSKNNKQAYAETIIEVLKDKEKLLQVSENCYNTLYSTWDKVAEKITVYYKKLTKKQK